MSADILYKADVVKKYLPSSLVPNSEASAFAPSNIALCKYWGKREALLNLPVNSSLSISLGHLGSHTSIRLSDTDQDVVLLNNKTQPLESSFSRKVIDFVCLFRREQHVPLIIDTRNNIPTAAGLASSASGFAALMLALNDFFNLKLEDSLMSAFARMGSGSASRSIFKGFVRWDMGQQADGMDSYSTQLEAQWADLCIGLIKVSSVQKPVDSRTGMNRTIETSKLYASWPAQANSDIIRLEKAINDKEFNDLGRCAEKNAMSMHATMMSAWPPLVYWLPESLAVMHKVWQLREAGVEVYFTMDAGPNLKLLFEKKTTKILQSEFSDMEVVEPFAN